MPVFFPSSGEWSLQVRAGPVVVGVAGNQDTWVLSLLWNQGRIQETEQGLGTETSGFFPC